MEGPEDDQNIENVDPTEKVNFPIVSSEWNLKRLFLQSLDNENDEEEHVDQLLKPEMSAKV